MTDEAADQAIEQSVEAKIASKFGFPAQNTEEVSQDTEVTESTQGSDTGLADLEWEGLTFKAPAKVKEALMRTEDYTRKTQELAEQRRAVEHVRELAQQNQLDKMFSDSIQNEQQEISVIDAYLQQATKLDWSQMNTDQMLRTKVEIDSIKERRAALKESMDSKRAKFQEEVKAKIGELRSKSRELASKAINGFNEQTEQDMRKYAISEGLTEQEIDNVLLDPRSFKVIWKAMQFDKVKAGTGQAAESATKAEKVLRPGSATERMPPEVANKLNFRKAMKGAKTSGEKANIIEDRLASIFK